MQFRSRRFSHKEVFTPTDGVSDVSYPITPTFTFAKALHCVALVMCLWFSSTAIAQSAFWSDSFESTDPSTCNGCGGVAFSANFANFLCGPGSTSYFDLSSYLSPTSFSFGNYSGKHLVDFWAGENIDAGFFCEENSQSANQKITWSNINISGRSSISFKGLFAANSTGLPTVWEGSAFGTLPQDYVIIEYSIDGGPWTKALAFYASSSIQSSSLSQDTNGDLIGDGNVLTRVFSEFTANIPGTGNNLSLRLSAHSDQLNEEFAIDNFRLLTNPPSLTATQSQVNTSCNGGCNGSASVVASGGVAPYTYAWSPSGGTAATASGLCAGNYTCTITDFASSTITKTFTITQPSAIAVSAASQTNVSCNGGNDGAASINTPTGGTPGYTYDWSPGTPTGDGTRSVTGLSAGNWTCAVTDNNGCTVIRAVLIGTLNTSSTPITAVSVPSSNCPNTDLTLTASGGISGTGSTIKWYSGPNGTGILLGTGNSIIVSPSLTTTYYVRREGLCNTTSDFSVVVNVKSFSYAANGTSSSTYCTDKSGWNHFYVGDEIILSVRGNLSSAGTITATIQDNDAYYFSPGSSGTTSCSCPVELGEAKFEMERNWNLNLDGGSLSGSYEVRFYYEPSEKTAIVDAANNWIAAYPTCGFSPKYSTTNGFYFFKNSGSNYSAPQYDGTQLFSSPGITPDGTSYTQFNGLTSFSGGSGAIILVPDPLLPIPTQVTETITACGSYEWHGNTYTSSNNNAIWVGTNAAGCDSTVTLNLTINQPSYATETITACGSYEWKGTTYTASNNTATWTGTNAAGCDSTVTLNLTLTPFTTNTVSVSACDSYTWPVNGQTYTASGTHIVNAGETVFFNSLSGLTSAVSAAGYTLSATQTFNSIAQGYASSLTGSFDAGSPTWTANAPDGLYNGEAGGSMTLSTNAAAYAGPPLTISFSPGVTSVGANFFITNIDFATVSGTITLTLSDGSSQSFYTNTANSFGGFVSHGAYITGIIIATSNGFVTVDNLVVSTGTINACVSEELNLTINHPSSSTETIVACGSYEWKGATYTTSNNTATWTGTNAAGCDSIVSLDLTIKQPSYAIETITACGSYEWHGNTYTSSNNTATWTGTNAAGCDSIVSLNLTITSLPTITANSNSPVCEGGALNLTATGVVTQPVVGNYSVESIAYAPVTPETAASAGPAGDDVVSGAISIGFNFTYYATTYTNLNISTNGFISFNNIYNSISAQAIPNAGSPNAVIALDWMDLNTNRGGTIDYFNLTSPNRFVVRFNGVATYENTGTVSGEIIIYDSGVIEIHNTAITTTGSAQTQGIENPTGTLASTVPGRNSAAWNATADAFRFTPPVGVGTYAWTGPSAFSVQNPSIASASTNNSGTYTVTFTDPFGCTASTTVDALVNPASSTTETIVACSSYEWHGNTYTASNNTATWVGTNAASCDSTVTLNLTINQPSYATETIVACGSYEWKGATYTTSNNTATWTGTNAAGCDSIVTLNLTINQPSYFTETITACGSYEWKGTTYTTSNNTATWIGTNAAGCDSIVTLNLTVNDCEPPVINCPSSLVINNCNSFLTLGDPTITDNSGSFENLSILNSNLSFDGVNDFVNTILDVSETAFTVEMWFKTNQTNGGIFMVKDGGGAYDRTVILTNGNIEARTYNDETIVTSGTNYADNNWHHLAFVLGQGGQKLYVDGILKASGIKSASDFHWQDRIAIGKSFSSPSAYFSGKITEFRIWNAARTQAEIIANMNARINPQAGLALCYHFNEGDLSGNNIGRTTAHDGSGNGNDGTLLNFDLTGSSSNWFNSVTNDAPATFPFGTTLVNWTAQDLAGNTSTCTQTVTIVNNVSYTTETIVACGSYEWHGTTYTSSNNTATWTGTNAAGCDSIVSLNLTINQPSYATETITACGSYAWHDSTYTASTNTATWTGTNAAGCDSIVSLDLTIKQPSYAIETITACGSYEWHGNTYTSSNNTATWTGTNAAGCDSIVSLNLTITSLPTITANSNSPVCEGGALNLTATGVVTQPVVGNYSVESIAYAPVTPETAASAGPAGDDVVSGAISIGFNFTYYATTYTNLNISTNGFISFNNIYNSISAQAIPNAGSPNAVIALDWMDLNTNRGGTIDYFNLTSPNRFVVRFNGVATYENTGTVSGEIIIYDSGVIEIHNTAITTTGSAQTQGIENPTGTLASTVPGRNSAAWNATADAFRFTPPVGVGTYAWTGPSAFSVQNPSIASASTNNSGTYTVTFTDPFGCTASTTVDALVNPASSTTETIVACSSYEWHGNTYTASNNTATWVGTNAASCDSTVTLNLTINQPSYATETIVACGSYEWKGATYTTSNNTATWTGTNAAGCDSIVTLNLTINQPSYFTETITACGSYEWKGTTYTTSNNTATWTGTNAAGCDSIVTLNLTINQPSYATETITACGSYEWKGTTYSSSTNNNIGGLIFGAPTWTGTNAAGCDSIVTLNLTINQPSYFTETIVACGSYEWHGTIYTSSTNDNGGIFGPGAGSLPTWTGTNSAGCDSIVSLNLTINPLPTPTISGTLAFCAGGSTTLDAGAGYASYLWSTGATTQTISVSNATSVSVTVTNAAGCSGTSASVTTTVNAVSAAPTSITSSVAFASTGVNFTLSVNGGSLGTGATWKWYTGSCGGTLIGTGASISVSQTANTAYFVRAEGTCNTTACATITVNSQCGATGVTSSAGTTAICAGSPVTLTVIGSLSPGAQWRWDDVCDNDDDGTNTTVSTFTVSPNSTKTYYVRSVGGACGLTACVPVTVNVIAKPATPGTISGSASVCPSTSVTYTIAAVAGATSYTWTAPTNATLVSAQGGTSMTVAYAGAFTSGTLKVKANNCSGSSSDKSLSIAKQAAPATPGNISGASAPCKGSTQTYSTSAVSGATSYTWTLPTGVTFVTGSSQTGTSIQVVVASTFNSGTLSVKANNCGGSSSNRTTTLTGQSAPTAPGTITGPSSVTQNTANNTFSVTNAAGMTYNWTVPAGCTITLGQGTSTIKVTWGTVAGNVNVTRNNGCGNSVASTKSVSVKRSEEAEADAGMESARTEETVETLVTTADELSAIAVYPNPTTGEARITFNTTSAGKYAISIVDLQGRVINSTSGAAIEGNNNIDINLSNCSNGVYMIHLMHNDSLQTMRVVKM